MKSNGELLLGYDKEADVLYISFGAPRKGAEYVEIGDMIVRVDPYTKQVVGLTITDFVKHYSAATQQVRLPVIGEFVLAAPA